MAAASGKVFTEGLYDDLLNTWTMLQEKTAIFAKELEENGALGRLVQNITESHADPDLPIMPPEFTTSMELCSALEAVNRTVAYGAGSASEKLVARDIITILESARNGRINGIGEAIPAKSDPKDYSIRALVNTHHQEFIDAARKIIENAVPRLGRMDRMSLDDKLDALAEQFGVTTPTLMTK